MMTNLSRTQIWGSWMLQLLAAGILVQTLFFKFTGAEESVYIFTTLGIEPWGRIGTGIAELVAACLLLVPALAPYGAVLAMALMTGAMASHLTRLGIEVKGDHGLLFALAVTTFVSSSAVAFLRRGDLPWVGRLLVAER